jgi:predicted CXXCH cytochrome family protein
MAINIVTGSDMATPRDTKAIAGRIDIQYHAHPHWFRWWRRVAVLLAVIGTGAWAAFVIAGKNERALNPGPVARAHATFEDNCAACHDHDGKQGFLKTVSDNACLACHTAASHHPLADLHPREQSGVHLTSRNNPMSAANCVVCHVEHRGHAQLMGTDDRLCVQCHGDLKNHVAEGAKLDAHLANAVTAFAPRHHPEFGRALPPPTTQAVAIAAPPVTTWADQTRLKFNHGRHLDPNGAIKIQGCASCHTSAVAPSVPPPGATVPAQAWKGATATAETAATSRRYMQPVNYERDCRSCHSVGLPATRDLEKFFNSKIVPIVSHDNMDGVRAQLGDLDRLYLSLVEDHPKLLKSGQSADEWLTAQREALAEVLKKVKKFGEALEDAQDAIQKTDEAREALKKELAKTPINPAKVKDLAEQIAAAESPQPPTEQSRMLLAAAAEYQVAILNSSSSCGKCHETQGKVMLPSEYSEALSSGKAQRIRTLPTGLPSSPRRWFASSEFDHDAHRNTACLTCHQGIDRDGLGKHEDDGIARLPAMQSCAACHFPDRSDQRGAGTACITCHNFHDRSKSEIAPK